MIKKILAVSVVVGLLAACETISEPGPTIARPDRPQPEQSAPEVQPEIYDEQEFVTTQALDGEEPVRVALLLPFSSQSDNVKKIAEAMSNAAQLAAFESQNNRYLLIPKDTKGTADGARMAAEEALREGAEIVLGPLFSESVLAAADVTRMAGIPLIAFSSNTAIAGDGVYLLSFPPEMEIARVTDFAVTKGFTRFGVLSPLSEYGDRVSTSFAQETFARGGIVVHEEKYEQSPDAMLQPAKRLAGYADKCSISDLNADEETGAYLPQPVFGSGGEGFQAVLVPEQGTLLRALAPLLPYYDVNVKCIKLLGVSAWNNPRLTREPALSGGWFAAPDPTMSENFRNRYKSVYDEAPPRLASLAYDAALLTAKLAQNPPGYRFVPANLADPNGYLGADGLFRLTPDGRVDRGLAILEIRASGIRVVDPAPTSFAAPVIDDEYGSLTGY